MKNYDSCAVAGCLKKKEKCLFIILIKFFIKESD